MLFNFNFFYYLILSIMYNFLIKVFKSIFLLLISIFKTLSGNYVPLLIVAAGVFYFLKFLSSRKLVLKCNNCENGSWYYRCKPYTGFGTRTCKHYTFVIDTTLEFIKMYNNSTEKYIKLVLILVEHTSRVLKKSVVFIDNMNGILALLMPHWLLFRYLVHPVTKLVYKNIRKVTDLLNNFSCAFTIPIINKKIDICSLIKDIMKHLLNLIKLVFDTVVNIIKEVGKTIFRFIKKYIFDQLIKLISAAIKIIVKDILGVIIKATQVFNEVLKPLSTIFSIPLHHYFILVIDALLNLILDIIPGGQILRKMPAIILGIIVAILFVLIVLPIIGAIIAYIPLIKALLYFILGLDDDNDLKFLFSFAFKFINKISSVFT